MKTETKVIVTFEKGDEELIFSKLPKDPCDKCGAGFGCCGCPEGRAYHEAIKPHKEHNVLELTEKANRFYEIKKEIEKLEEERKTLAREFSEIGLDITLIYDCMED